MKGGQSDAHLPKIRRRMDRRLLTHRQPLPSCAIHNASIQRRPPDRNHRGHQSFLCAIHPGCRRYQALDDRNLDAPLKGDVVPVDLPPPRSSSTVTVVSTALPTFSIRNASGVTSLALPAASIFTIDKQAEKFVSVHNMFDIAKVYAAVQCST